MSLIDELRDVGAALPTSHIPGLAEALPILGALIACAEYDVEKLVAAAEEDRTARDRGEVPAAVDNILAPPEEASDGPVPTSNAQAPTPTAVQPPSDQAELVQVREQRDDLARQVQELSQQVQTLIANQQRTAATVTPTEPAPADPAPADTTATPSPMTRPTEPGPSNPEGLS